MSRRKNKRILHSNKSDVRLYCSPGSQLNQNERTELQILSLKTGKRNSKGQKAIRYKGTSDEAK